MKSLAGVNMVQLSKEMPLTPDDVVLDDQGYNLLGPMEMRLAEGQVMYAVGSRLYIMTLPRSPACLSPSDDNNTNNTNNNYTNHHNTHSNKNNQHQ